MRTQLTCKFGLAIAVLVLSVTTGYARQGRFGAGISGGKVWTVEETAREGGNEKHNLERFTNTQTWAANLDYLWEIFPDTYGGLGLTVENYNMTLRQKGWPGQRPANVGRLEMTPILLAVKLQSFPRQERGWGGHMDFGAGVVTSDFTPGPDYYVRATSLEVTTKESAIYTIAGGLDYFFAKHWAAAMTVRYIYGSIDHTWRSLAGTDPGVHADSTQFNISHVQLLIGLQAYF